MSAKLFLLVGNEVQQSLIGYLILENRTGDKRCRKNLMINIVALNDVVVLFFNACLRIVSFSVVDVISGEVRILNSEDVRPVTMFCRSIGSELTGEAADSRGAFERKMADVIRWHPRIIPTEEVNGTFPRAINQESVALRVLPELKRNSLSVYH
jgi:hypothetical protein